MSATAVDTASVSEVVVEAVAETTARDATDLEPLFEVVDPDALDALFTSRSPGRGRDPMGITFEYGGHRVTVERDADGTTTVTIGHEVDR